MRDGYDTHAFWMGYMLGTVKDAARRTHDKSCVDALREFCDNSKLVADSDLEALERALGDDDPLYQGNIDLEQRSAELEAQDILPALRLAGAFECNPDENSGAA